MSKIYLVTDGEYSDYHIIGAFSTRQKAEAFCSMLERRPDIEELTLDLAYPESPGLSLWSVCMYRDGAVWRADKPSWVDAESVTSTAAPWFRGWKPDRERARGGFTGRTFLWQNVLARDEEHAVKIVNEYRAQLIATGAWQEDKS